VNERDDQRVIEALQALTGGLTVTEQDIVTSGARLRNSLEPPPPRRRLALVVAAAAVVLVAGVAGLLLIDRDDNAAPEPVTPLPSPAETLIAALQTDPYAQPEADFLEGAAPTRETLAGLWVLRWPYDQVNLVVDGDGDWSHEGLAERGIGGPSTLVGDTWTRRVAGSPDCGDGGSLPWKAAIAGDTSLHLQFTGLVNVCTPADDREVWDRIAPGSPIADYLLAMSADVDWRLQLSLDSPGVYVAPGSGYVLDVAEDSSYSYYEDLTERQLAATCSGRHLAGPVEFGRTPAVDGYLFDAKVVRITTTQTGCGSVVAGQGLWVKLGSSAE